MTDKVDNLMLHRFLKRINIVKDGLRELNEKASSINAELAKNIGNQRLINEQLEREIAAYKERAAKRDLEEQAQKKERHLHIVK